MGTDIIIKDIGSEKEQTLQGSGQLVVQKADMFVVDSAEAYALGGEFLKEIKAGIKVVTDTFIDMKNAAHAAHKAVCEKEKGFLSPLQQAEITVKQKMRRYNDLVELERREQEARLKEEQRRLAEEQMKRALELEQNGHKEQAQAALQSVTALENLNPVIQSESAKVDGISTQVDYDVEITDETLVPAYINGMELRKINLTAIKQLAKASKGTIQIPGVKISKTNIIRVR